jgi:hypothetical protein
MVEIEIVKDWKSCWKKGMKREVQDHFAAVLLELGYAVKTERQKEKEKKNG